MDKMAINMRRSGSDQDVAVILFSSHGEMVEGQFYLVPYGFDVGTPTAMETSAVSADEFARKVKVLAERGKVLLLLDACHSGAVGPGGSVANPDASVLRSADPEGRGVISMPELIKAMDKELATMTKGAQHLGPRVNFLGDVFVVSH